MDTGEVKSFLSKAGYSESDMEPALNLLVWFGILGVQESTQDRARYAYQVRHNIEKVLAPLRQGGGYFVLHPAFRTALESSIF
jgi:hypothetical protein